jgi:signal transduction histidine kinase/CheY-like chemotaxis protein
MRTYSEIATEVDFRSPPEPVLLAAMFLAILLSSAPELLHADRQLPFGLAFMALPVLVWATAARWPRPGRWLTLVVVVLFCHVLALWSQLPGAWAVVIFSVIIGAALTGFTGAMISATIECGLLFLARQWGILDPATPGVMMLAMIWGVVAALLLIYRPLDEFARWSWDHYRKAQRLLDEARDRQVELKQVLADLADANVQLDRLNRLAQGLREVAEDARRAKEQFVANLSHELRTPLNMIVGFSQMMLRSPRVYGANLPPALLSDLNVILRNSQHLSSLIDDVLDLSQIEAGRMALTKERVAVSRIVDAATTAVRPLYESKGLTLAIAVAGDLPAVFCDQVRMREVLLNLLSNAGRFTEQGGVSVRVWQDKDSVMFGVADTGPGIADEHRERIFRPFEQVDGSLRRTHGGSGLGLSISKAFVELHGGQMWFESEVGRGTTFFIRLPVDPPAQLGRDVATRWLQPGWEFRQRTRASLAPKPAMPPRFIILEPDSVLQSLVSRYIDDAETVHAPGLDAACAEFQRAPAQALLINSASMAETLQEVYDSHKLPPGLPAIACSIPSSQEAASALGVSDYLIKPVSQEQLLQAIDRLAIHVRTILVVDDEPDAQQLFQRMLASAQRRYRVLRAGSGREALAILRGQRVDVVLLDMVMPEMDGLQILEEIRRDDALHHTTVVAVTGRDPAGHAVATHTLGVTTAQGLSAVQLLATIQEISALLSAVQPRDQAPPVAQAG